MQFSKVPLLLGVIGATGLTIGTDVQAQNAARSNAPRIPTAVDAFGNVVRNRASDVQSVQPNLGANNSTSSNRYQRGDGRNDNRNYNRGNGRNDGRGNGRNNNWNNGQGGGNYYAPASPYYPYPYGAPVYNNYYYPGVPTTTAITPQIFSWQRPATITSIPLGNVYSYPAPGYGYGYPLPPYGNNYSAYNGVPYPAYGTTTFVYGNGGGIYSQSQTSGYGIGIGQGGLSVRLGNSRTSSSTTVVNR